MRRPRGAPEIWLTAGALALTLALVGLALFFLEGIWLYIMVMAPMTFCTAFIWELWRAKS
jgi:hypothetical protein